MLGFLYLLLLNFARSRDEYFYFVEIEVRRDGDLF